GQRAGGRARLRGNGCPARGASPRSPRQRKRSREVSPGRRCRSRHWADIDPGDITPYPLSGLGSDASAHERRRLGEHLAEDADHLVELLLPGDEWRGDLQDGVAAVVRAADEPGVEERVREEPAQQALALLIREGLARVLVL